MTAWLLLALAIITEVVATTTLTYSHGLTRHALTALTAALYIASYVSLARALKAGLEISVAYAIWSGIGTAALAVIGAWLFGEGMTLRKTAAIALIIGGVALLHLSSTTGAVPRTGQPILSAEPAPHSQTTPDPRTQP